jgi:Lrp/AsnC family leucine-responsive transcriptional regulator
MTIRAFIGVRRDPTASVEALSHGLRSIPEVAGCWIVTGEHDFFFDVRARDMDTFSNVLLHHVQKVPGVVATVSTYVLTDFQSTPVSE